MHIGQALRRLYTGLTPPDSVPPFGLRQVTQSPIINATIVEEALGEGKNDCTNIAIPGLARRFFIVLIYFLC